MAKTKLVFKASDDPNKSMVGPLGLEIVVYNDSAIKLDPNAALFDLNLGDRFSKGEQITRLSTYWLLELKHVVDTAIAHLEANAERIDDGTNKWGWLMPTEKAPKNLPKKKVAKKAKKK